MHKFDPVLSIQESASINANGEAYIFNSYPKRSTVGLDYPPKTLEQKKQWKLNRNKREIQNASGYQYYNKVYKLKFYTFTIPSDKLIHLPVEKRHLLASSKLSVFLNNMRNNYGLGRYIWTREITKKGIPHFHAIFDIPKLDLPKLSVSWSRCWGHDANNSIDSKTIYGYKKVVNYCAKYMTKANYKMPGRGFAISQGLSVDNPSKGYVNSRKPLIIDASELPAMKRESLVILNQYVSLLSGPQIEALYKDWSLFLSQTAKKTISMHF